MPPVIIYLGIMLAVIFLWFMMLKRPIYEGVIISFVLLVAITGTFANLWIYITEALNTSLLYSMIAFVAMSQILSKTKIIDNCVMIIIALLGRVPGGAGYASVLASSFMGALSGSGPGNVMSTGTITIPAMKKTGFPPELAANIVSASSYLGNMIPPSANIVAALGAYLAVYGDDAITTGSFWMVCWSVSLWFILSRIIMVFAFCKFYKIKPMAKDDIPSLKQTMREGWTGLLLPVIVLAPFMFDAIFNAGFLTDRLGAAGAKHFSSSLLIFIPGITALIGLLISHDRKIFNLKKIIEILSNGVKGLAPTVATCIFGYMIGELFADIKAGEGLQVFLQDLALGRVGLAFVIPLICCFVTMVIPGSSVVVMFGSMFITLFASVGSNPLLVAAMLPCICGVMGGITPPFALGMYAGMSIAESDLDKTLKNDLWWVAIQYIMEVIILLELLPNFGL